jgi:hypothetical protein
MSRPHIPNNRRFALFRACALIAVWACATGASAQETRADALAQERAAKPEQSPTVAGLERTLAWAEAWLGDMTRDGFHIEMGDMSPGAGPSIDPVYQLHILGNRAIVRASGAVSSRGSTMLRARVEWPDVVDKLSVGTELNYQNLTQVYYFGIGERSAETDGTNYALRDVDALGFATFRPTRSISIGSRLGVLRNASIGGGTSTLLPSIGERFDELTAPGLTAEPTFVHADASVDVDTRNVPGHPSNGGRYRVTAAAFRDQGLGRHSFNQLDIDGAHYIPVFHENWVVALRGRAVLSQTEAGQEVPFYLLPTLGGSNTLRGFLDYRFRDRNLLLFSAEYQWPIFRALDGGVFYDAGTVAPTVQSFAWRHAHNDFGIAARFHSETRTVLRIDVARSAEGIRALVSFSAPLGASSRTVAPFAP